MSGAAAAAEAVAAISALRLRVRDLSDDPAARAEAEAALAARRTLCADTIVADWEAESDPKALLVKEHWAMGVTGKDKRGRPVQVNRLARVSAWWGIDGPWLLSRS